jgi:phage virion morphogenesis protein
MAGTSGATLKWGGFDKGVNNFLDKVQNQRRALLEACGDALVTGTLKRFEQEKAPDGSNWAPVDRSGKILTDTARLQRSIDSAVSGDTVLVGSNLVYALIHQKGGEIRPVKKKSLKFKVGGKWINAKKVTIKARPYLGISKEDWEELADTIHDFINGAFEV